MKIIKEFARFAVAGLFIFSGLIKLNDPVGTAIKLEEYFQVFSQDFASFFEIFVPAALFLSVFLSVLEVLLGVALIIGYRMKLTSFVLVAMIIFFTALTFYSASTGKVTDCGCFGDAIKLTPWESFYKDLILLVLIFVIAFNFHSYKSIGSVKFQNIMIGSSTVVFTLIALMAIWYLPFIDFRSYKVGNNISVLMQPEEPARYEYVMEKDGEEFRFESYPTEPGYTLVTAEVMNEDKATPKITDFGVWNDDGEFTEEVLQGAKLIFIFHDVNKAKLKALESMKDLAKNTGADTWILTSSTYEDFELFRHQQQLGIPYFFADATVLKAMIRSNPGIVTLKNGVVTGKWHFNSVPDLQEVKDRLK